MKKIFFALMMGLAICACTPEAYDDTAIKEQIDNLDDRLTKVEEDLATLELNVAAMKTLAEALKTGKYIESVTPLEDGTGYTITFSDETTIVIKNGEKGDKGETGDKGDKGDTGAAGVDGKTPTVAVKEVDGVLYWFINGEQGPAVYEEAPVFTSVDGNLYVTYPGGEPQFVGALTGVSIFKSVVVNEEEGTVTFTFVGENGEAGDSFDLPLAEKFALEISESVGLAKEQTSVEIPYTVKGANATTTVDVLAVACEAVVEVEVIKVSNIAAGAQMLVFADNGEGKTSIRKVVFSAENYSVEAVDYVIPAEGGQVVVKGVSNVPFEVVIPAEAAWLTQVVTKSAFELTFAAEKNEGEERSAKVDFVRKGTEEVLMTVTITQPGVAKSLFTRVWGYYSVPESNWFDGVADNLKGSWYGGDTNLAMDDEYIYIPFGTGTPGIYKINIKTQEISTLPVDGISGGTYPTSCVRIVKNTDSSVNNGKDVLLVGNLALANEPLNFYAYVNGIDNAPVKVYSLNSARRFGDKFSVSGTWQSGIIWLRSNQDSPLEAVIPINNGALQTWIDPYRITNEDDECISEISWYPVSDNTKQDYCLMSTTSDIGVHLMKGCSVAGAATEEAVFPELAKTFGYKFFEFGGKKYIAWTSLKYGNSKPRLQVIEGDGSTMESLKDALTNYSERLVAEFALSNADNDFDFAGNPAAKTLCDCDVRVTEDAVYIAALGENCGLSLIKLTLE